MTVDKAALRDLADTLNGILLPEGYNRQALKDAAVALPALLDEIDALKARLEINPDAPEWDGIACRDETIRQLEREKDRLERGCRLAVMALAYACETNEALYGEAYKAVSDALNPPAPPQGETA